MQANVLPGPVTQELAVTLLFLCPSSELLHLSAQTFLEEISSARIVPMQLCGHGGRAVDGQRGAGGASTLGHHH